MKVKSPNGATGTVPRILPNDRQAEAAVLGALMLDGSAITKIADFLVPDDFYVPDHVTVYRAAVKLFERSEPIDVMTLTAELKRLGVFDRLNGPELLAELEGSVPTAANVEYYARIVLDAATKRKLNDAGEAIVRLAFDHTTPADEALDSAEATIFRIAERRIIKNFVLIKDALKKAWDRIEKMQTDAVPLGVPSGFRDLDAKTGGFQNSNLVIVASRPGVGKTSFVLNIAQNAATQFQVPVGIFSLEMSEQELVQRLLCSEAGIDSYRLRNGMLKDAEWPRIAQAMGTLSDAQIYIEESPVLSILELRTKARRLKAANNIGLLIVDYLQLVQGRNQENRVQEISDISRSLKGLARELDIPVLACSQLSREPEKREDHRPQLADLRESGGIEQDADLVLFIYRDRFYNRDLPEEKRNIAELIIAKHRNGPTGKIDLFFVEEQTKFVNLSQRGGGTSQKQLSPDRATTLSKLENNRMLISE